MYGPLFLNYPAFLSPLGLPRMPLDEVYPFDNSPILVRENLQDFTGLPAIVPGNHHHRVTFF